MHAFDRQTDSNLIVRPRCIPCTAVKIKTTTCMSDPSSPAKMATKTVYACDVMIYYSSIILTYHNEHSTGYVAAMQ